MPWEFNHIRRASNNKTILIISNNNNEYQTTNKINKKYIDFMLKNLTTHTNNPRGVCELTSLKKLQKNTTENRAVEQTADMKKRGGRGGRK